MPAYIIYKHRFRLEYRYIGSRILLFIYYYHLVFHFEIEFLQPFVTKHSTNRFLLNFLTILSLTYLQVYAIDQKIESFKCVQFDVPLN